MRTMPRFARLLSVVLVGMSLGICACLSVQAAAPKRILIIHSFGRDFAPFDTVVSVFRKELAKALPESIALFETTLDAGREVTKEEEQAFLEYLRTRFTGSAPDLVVTIGAPAARFFLGHRDQLFPSPLIIAALDERLAKGAALRTNDAAAVTTVNIRSLLENIFQLLPETSTIAVVGGKSAMEQFWTSELQREAAQFKDRARFEWLNDLSLEQMKDRVANLPPRSVVFYALLIVDAAGVPHERQDALTALHASANAPIFGLYESELGKGVVGGPYSSQRTNGEQIAKAAVDVLHATSPAEPRVTVRAFETPVYDWRELRRWNIDPSRLPPGSEVRFKPPSIWQEHRVAIIVAVSVIALQTLLIGALLWQRIGRRRAEREARSLGGRLITAHEDERRRLARELHDDITQRLAALAIQAANLGNTSIGAASSESADVMRERLAGLSEDVHALSYRLHPTVIEDLGLAEALKAECDRVSRSETLDVKLDVGTVSGKLPPGAAVGLFRVAQEALRNIVRHAKATDVQVALHTSKRGLVLAVRDNGIGFRATSERSAASLGLASMRERMRLLDGALDIDSVPGRGTTITAWVPLPEGA